MLKNEIIHRLELLKSKEIDTLTIGNNFFFKFRDQRNNTKNFLKKKINFELKRLFSSKTDNEFLNKNIKFETVIISHLVRCNNKNEIIDEYMNIIKEKFKNTHDTLELFINHTELEKKQIISTFNKFYTHILDKRFSLIKEFEIYFRFIISYFKYLKLKKKLNINISAKNYFSGISHYRIAYKIFIIIRKFNIKNIYIPFEGHAWEKLLYLFTYDMKIKRIAYQFIINDKNLSNLLYLKNSRISPDIIYVTGTKVKDLINKINKNIICEVIGSKKIYKTKENFGFNKNILVIPEGIDGEIDLFQKFIKQYTLIDSSITFYLKLHPLYKSFNSKNKNIKVYDDNLNKLIKNCDIVLYRGSSLIFNLLYNNVVPIYLNITSENISLLNDDFLSYIVSSPEELKKLISQIYSDRNKIFQIQKNNFKNITKYYKPI